MTPEQIAEAHSWTLTLNAMPWPFGPWAVYRERSGIYGDAPYAFATGLTAEAAIAQAVDLVCDEDCPQCRGCACGQCVSGQDRSCPVVAHPVLDPRD